MRFKFVDILLFVLVFIFVAAFPFDLLPLDFTLRLAVQVGLRFLLVAYYIYIIIKYKIKIFGIANIKNLLLCIPFFLVSFSNLTASLIAGGFNGPGALSEIDFTLYIVLTMEVAISEEIVFRLFIHNALVRTTSLKRILGSAAIFALMHLLNAVNVSSVEGLITVLIQTIYTFGLGLLLGVMYEYSHSLVGAMLLHFCFNMFNQVIYLYVGGFSSELCYYLTAVGYAVVVGGYATLITFLYFRKYDLYFR